MHKHRQTKLLFLFTLFLIFMSALKTSVSADIPSALSKANPVIQIIEYKIVDGNVELDSEFTLEITLKNCNAYSTAYNVIVDSSSQDMSLRLSDNQINQTYFEAINPNETVTFKQTYSLEKTYPHKSAMLTFNFTYFGENGNEFKNRSVITPEVIIPCKLKLNVLSVASTTSIGAQTLINLRCTNDSTIDMSHLTMIIEGNIIENQKIHDLGALKAGQQVAMDCSVNFLKVGAQSLKISFEYKDEAGISYTLPSSEYPVEVTSENVISVDSPSEEKKGTFYIAGKAFNIKLFIIGIFSIVILSYVIIQLFKQIKKERNLL